MNQLPLLNLPASQEPMGSYGRVLNIKLNEWLGKLRYTVNRLIDEKGTTESITADATAPADRNTLYIADTTSGNIVITLPEINAAMVTEKREVIAKKIVAANTLTLTPSGTNTVDGAASKAITTLNASARLIATTGKWVVI